MLSKFKSWLILTSLEEIQAVCCWWFFIFAYVGIAAYLVQEWLIALGFFLGAAMVPLMAVFLLSYKTRLTRKAKDAIRKL